MAESQLSQTVIGYSTAVESAYATYPVLANLYTPTVTRVRAMPVPATEKSDDLGVLGRGENRASYQRSGFAIPTSFELSDMVQVGSLAKLLRRYTGATAATPATVEASIAFKHSFFELNPTSGGLQLPSSSFVYSLNEYDFLLPGGVGSTLQLSQQGAADPTYTLGIVCSGSKVRVSDISPSFGSLAVPDLDPYMYGASSAIQYVDDASATVSLVTPSHKARDITFSANNNLDTGDTRMGMPQIDSTEPKRGWYRDFLHFGDREVSAELTLGMDSDYSLKDAEELNTVYTMFKWDMFGDFIPTTASNNKYGLTVIIPKFNLRSPAAGEASNQKSTKSFTVFPLVHAGYYGVYKLELTNGVSTAIS